jgi:hypothetical protein
MLKNKIGFIGLAVFGLCALNAGLAHAGGVSQSVANQTVEVNSAADDDAPLSYLLPAGGTDKRRNDAKPAAPAHDIVRLGGSDKKVPRWAEYKVTAVTTWDKTTTVSTYLSSEPPLIDGDIIRVQAVERRQFVVLTPMGGLGYRLVTTMVSFNAAITEVFVEHIDQRKNR